MEVLANQPSDGLCNTGSLQDETARLAFNITFMAAGELESLASAASSAKGSGWW